jgi:hypothetical protein
LDTGKTLGGTQMDNQNSQMNQLLKEIFSWEIHLLGSLCNSSKKF